MLLMCTVSKMRSVTSIYCLLLCVQICPEARSVDSRWKTLPPVENNVFIGENKTFEWTFKDESHDKASVTLIHAPPNLRYEFSVAYGEINLKENDTELTVFYEYLGRVKVTYHSDTVIMYILNCTADDRGEISIQVNFDVEVPLTYSLFLYIYKEPNWRHIPNPVLTHTVGEDVIFSLEVERGDFTPPVTEVVVSFFSDSQSTQEKQANASMVITPPDGNGVMKIECEPIQFHRKLRYIGGADLHQLEFIIPHLDHHRTGVYTIVVVFGTINYLINQELALTISERATATQSSTELSQTITTENLDVLSTKTTTHYILNLSQVNFYVTLVFTLVVVAQLIILIVLAVKLRQQKLNKINEHHVSSHGYVP